MKTIIVLIIFLVCINYANSQTLWGINCGSDEYKNWSMRYSDNEPVYYKENFLIFSYVFYTKNIYSFTSDRKYYAMYWTVKQYIINNFGDEYENTDIIPEKAIDDNKYLEYCVNKGDAVIRKHWINDKKHIYLLWNTDGIIIFAGNEMK